MGLRLIEQGDDEDEQCYAYFIQLRPAVPAVSLCL